jgi:hypothetical protein
MRIFFHQAIFFMFGNRKESRGLNLENTVDVAAIRSPIPPISLRQGGIGMPAHWLGGTVLSFSSSGAVFPSIHRQIIICPIIKHNTTLWSFFLFPNSKRNSTFYVYLLVHQKLPDGIVVCTDDNYSCIFFFKYGNFKCAYGQVWWLIPGMIN